MICLQGYLCHFSNSLSLSPLNSLSGIENFFVSRKIGPILSAGFDGMMPRSRWSTTSWSWWGWRGGKTRDYPRPSHQWCHRQGLRPNQSTNSLWQDLGHAQRVERLRDRELRQFGCRGLILLIPSSLVAALSLMHATTAQWESCVGGGNWSLCDQWRSNTRPHLSQWESLYETNLKFLFKSISTIRSVSLSSFPLSLSLVYLETNVGHNAKRGKSF